MEIVIIKEFSQVQKDANELAWKIYRKKSFNSFLLILTAGLLLLLSGAFSKYESSFWNFRTSIGIGFLLMASFSLLKIFELKSTLFSLHKKNTIKNEEEFVKYSISDNGINCKSENSSSQTTWANYKFYKLGIYWV